MSIQQIRNTLGLSKTQLADQLGVSVRSVHHWESGTRQPSRQTMTQLAALMQAKEGSNYGKEH